MSLLEKGNFAGASPALALVLVLILSVLLLSSCTTTSSHSLQSREDVANKIASEHGFIAKDVSTSSFTLRVYKKTAKTVVYSTPAYPKNYPTILHVYFEGDGLAWINKKTLSDNPTPINPVGLRLAVINNSAKVAYIARPCQYVVDELCEPRFWANYRYSALVVASVNEVVDYLKTKSNAQYLHFTGFSGGGAIAVLVASLRDDVKKIITFNGNLNHELMSKIHGLSILYGSLNPIDVAKKISHIPQIHYIGELDKIIVPNIAMSFKKRSGKNSPVKVIVLPNQHHQLNIDLLRDFLISYF